MKKVTKIIISVVAAIFLILSTVAVVFTVEWNKIVQDTELHKKASEQGNILISTGKILSFMDFLDEQNIKVDEKVYNELKTASEKMFDNIYEKTLSCDALASLAFMNSYFSLGKDDYIKSLFDRFYSEKYHLLRYEIDTDDNFDTVEIDGSAYDETDYVKDLVSYCSFPLIMLKKADFDFSEYKIEEELVKLYNDCADKYAKKFSEDDFTTDDSDMSLLSDIKAYFIYTDGLDKINYKKLEPWFFDDEDDITDENESKYMNFFHLCSTSESFIQYKNDYSHVEKAEEAYLALKTDEDFDMISALDLSVFVNVFSKSGIKRADTNKYFVQNCNRWVHEIYQKEIIEKCKDWLGEL